MLVIDLGTEKFFDLAGAGAVGFGAPQTMELTNGCYDVRVLGGPVIIKLGGAPVTRAHVVIVQECPPPIHLRGMVTFAAQSSVPSRVYVTRMVDDATVCREISALSPEQKKATARSCA